MITFNKHPAFIIHTQSPFNGGPPLELLRQNFITPQTLFYVRNHGPAPRVDPACYRLSVSGLVRRPLTFSLTEIRKRFPKRRVVATLQCAGNRRQELRHIAPIPNNVPWGPEAISNAIWSGVSLKDILAAAGIKSDAWYVSFTGLDEIENDEGCFGASIPIEKAVSSEVLLAYEMNGSPLTPEHGFPLRVVVPGYIGARSVKWLSQIVLQSTPALNDDQSYAYKLFPPGTRAETTVGSVGLPLREFAVNAVICCPQEGALIMANPILVQGYAISGGGRRIARLDVSLDEGQTWVTANLVGEDHPWAWRFWECELNLQPGEHQIVARAWDSAANTQPENPKHLWNFQGYANNAWHRIAIRCEG